MEGRAKFIADYMEDMLEGKDFTKFKVAIYSEYDDIATILQVPSKPNTVLPYTCNNADAKELYDYFVKKGMNGGEKHEAKPQKGGVILIESLYS